MVIGFDRSKKPNFSIKAMQIAEEKQAVAQYGSSDFGASLGDILGAALKEKAGKAAEEPTKKKKQVTGKAAFLDGTPRQSCLRADKAFLTAYRCKRPPVAGGVRGRHMP